MFKKIILICFGNGLAQAIQLLALPLLAHLYSPNSMGEYFFAISVSTIISVFFSLQLHQAIPNKEKISDVINIVKTIFLVSSLFFGILFLWLIFFKTNNDQLILWSSLFSLSSLAVNIIRMIFIRLGWFNKINFLMVMRSLLIISMQFILFFITNNNGILLGFLIGEIAAIMLMVIIVKVNILKYLPTSKNFIQNTINSNKDFVFFGAPQELIAVLTLGLPIVIIQNIYGEDLAGQFGMAQRLIFPVATITLGAVVNVLQNQYGTKERFLLIELFTWKFMSIAGASLFILLPIAYYLTGFFVKTILSSEWYIAVDISKYMVLWAIFLLISSPFRTSCRIYSLQYLQLISDSITFLILIGIYLFQNYLNLSFMSLIQLFASIGILQNIMIIFLVKFIPKKMVK